MSQVIEISLEDARAYDDMEDEYVNKKADLFWFEHEHPQCTLNISNRKVEVDRLKERLDAFLVAIQLKYNVIPDKQSRLVIDWETRHWKTDIVKAMLYVFDD